jgi:hypothetical protein
MIGQLSPEDRAALLAQLGNGQVPAEKPPEKPPKKVPEKPTGKGKK